MNKGGISCLFLLGACGASSVSSQQVPDADPGALIVYVSSDQEVQGGVPVMFHDEAGNHIETLVTDDDGVVRSLQTESGMVTVVRGDNENAKDLWTMGGAARGQVIEAFARTSSGTSLGSIDFELEPNGGTVRGIHLGCTKKRGFMDSYSVELASRCVGKSGKIPFVAYHESGAGLPVAYVFGEVEHPLDGSNVTFQVGQWQTVFDSYSLMVSNASMFPLTNLDSQIDLDGVYLDWFSNQSLASGMVSLEVLFPAGVSATKRIALFGAVYGTLMEPVGIGGFVHIPTTAEVARTIDSSEIPVPITSVSYNPNSRRLSIETSEIEGTLTSVRLNWADNSVNYNWELVFPRGTTNEYLVPALPTMFSSWQPGAEVAGTVLTGQADFLSSFEETRDTIAANEGNLPINPQGETTIWMSLGAIE